MLYFSAAFLVIALLAGALGFGGIAGSATVIAQIVFTVFLTLSGVSVLLRENRRAGSPHNDSTSTRPV